MPKVEVLADRTGDRVGRIGSSDVPAILGLSAYKSALKVWRIVTGRDPSDDLTRSLHVQVGVGCEALALAEYGHRMGVNVVSPGTHTHPDAPYITASADGYADGVVVEVKTTFAKWPEPLPAHWCQAQWQAMVLTASGTPVDALVVAVLRLGGRAPVLEVHRRPYDADAAGADFDTVRQWWADYVVADTPPPATGESVTDGALGRTYDGPNTGAILDADDDARDLIAALDVWRQREKYAAAQYAEIRAKLCDVIGDNRGIKADGVGRVTWTRSKGRVITDWEALARGFNPSDDAIARHTTTSAGGRRFNYYAPKPPKQGDE